MPFFTTLAITGLAVAAWKKRKKNKEPIESENKVAEIVSTANSVDITEEEITNYQQVSFTALGLTGLGSLFYAPFTLLSIPLLGYNYFYYLKRTHSSLTKNKNVALALFELFAVTSVFVTGHYLITAFLCSGHFTAHKIILKTKRKTHDDFNQLFGDFPKMVWLLQDQVEIEIPLNQIQIKDVVVVRAGEMIAVDGIIISGEGDVDQCMLTGESQVVEKNKNDNVFASTLLLSGCLHIQVEKQGEETVAGKIVKVLENTIDFKSEVQTKGDEIVNKGAKTSLLSTVIALPIIGFSHAAALSWVGFGYQMRYSAPLSVLNYLRISSNHGILVKDGRALEILQDIDVFVFDKTGTLTQNIPDVVQIIACHSTSQTELLQYAASAEQYQQHPVAQAILSEAVTQNIPLLTLKDSNYEMGLGIRVVFNDANEREQFVLLGSFRFMKKLAVSIPESIQTLAAEAMQKGHSFVYMANNENIFLGVIELRPSLRPEAFEVVKQLEQMGKELCIISGDQATTTQYLAETLGIKNYHAEVLPEDKAKIITQLKEEGKKVCFVGDGINDAVALQTADVSISLQGAASIAIDVADIVLIKPDLSSLLYLVTMSKELNQSLNRSMHLNTGSSIACVSGILFFGMGLSAAVLFYYSTLGLNVGNAMLPLLKEKMDDKK